MKKIAFYMHNFNGGGAEKVTIKTAEELANRGYDVTLIMRENKGILSNNIPVNIKVIDLKINGNSKIFKNLINIVKLGKLLKENDYEVIFGVTFNMSVLLALSSMLYINKSRLFAIMHSTISQEKHKLMRIRKIIMNKVSKKFEKIIFVSEGARVDYIKTMNIDSIKTTTIYNPIVSKEISKKENENVDCDWINYKNDYKIIINIGRLTIEKNQKLLLNAIKLVSKKEKVKLIVLGDGALKDKLNKIAEENGISDIVKFYGFVNNPYSFLAKADLLVLSSKYEGLPTVLIEALACGCNVVSTDCPTGPNEILENGTYGKLVPLDNEEEMASAILYMLNDGKISSDVLKKRSEKFSVENSIKKYIKLMEG